MGIIKGELDPIIEQVLIQAGVSPPWLGRIQVSIIGFMDKQPDAHLRNYDVHGRISRVNPHEQELAWDPNTSPQVLHKLGKSSDPVIRQGLAGNPNTPVQLLQQLGMEFPQIVVRNPILPLLFLENYQIIDELIPQVTREELVVNAETTQGILGMLVHSAIAPIAEAASLHVNWQGETDKGWQEVWLERVAVLFEDELNWEYDIEYWVKLGFLNETIWGQFPDHPMAILAQAGSIHTPVDDLDNLAAHETLFVKLAVASNSQTSISTLEQLSRDPLMQVRRVVAKNPNLPGYLLKTLADDSTLFVRLGVMINPETPLEILKQFVNNTPGMIPVILVHQNKHFTEIFQALRDKSDQSLRRALLRIPNLPRVFWEQLGTDKIGSDYEFVAVNPKIPTFILEQLFNHPDGKVREYLAMNQRLPTLMYEALAQDPSDQVRYNLAYLNGSIPTHVMEQLIGNPQSYSLPQMISNPALHFQHLFLADRYLQRNPSGLRFVLESLARYIPQLLTRLLALLHPQTRSSALVASANHFDWVVRGAIATNPQTPRETLQQLAQDANWVVREAAQSTLEKDAG